MSKTIIFSKSTTFMRWILKRRRLIAIAVILCICFLIYQLFSLKQLNVHMFETNKKSKYHNQMSSVFTINHHIIKPVIEGNYHTIANQKQISVDESHVNEDQQMDEKTEQKLLINKVIIGVMPKFYPLYQNRNDLFRCLSGEEIPYSYVNDNFCDCEDGASDEPSTNACPLHQFYCTKNLKNQQNVIPSSKVNDGICDCCDGSDEVKGVSPPLILSSSQIKTMKSSRKLVSSPPCPDRCTF